MNKSEKQIFEGIIKDIDDLIFKYSQRETGLDITDVCCMLESIKSIATLRIKGTNEYIINKAKEYTSFWDIQQYK